MGQKEKKGGSSFRLVYLSLIVLLLLPLLTSCGKKDMPLSRTGEYFDTVITVTVYDGDEGDLDACFALAERYEGLFSATDKGSDIGRINAAGGRPVKVDKETIRLIREGIRYGKISGGKFSLSVGALSSLWKRAIQEEKIPTEEEIEKASATMGDEGIEISGDEVILHKPGAAIDLGAIAKGYIADRMKEALLKRGVGSALINLGGNVLAVGEKPGGAPFRIGIKKPFSEEGDVLLSIPIRDKSVVTSGTYERYFKGDDGTIYHHIIDPATGRPGETGLDSVTIISHRSVDGDALSTTCFLLGPEKGLSLIESLKDTECIMVETDGTIIKSSGIGKEVK